MNSKFINSTDYERLTVASLPSNPTAKVGFGGLGYSATEMKQAFDALPLFIIDRLNMLIADLSASPNESVSTAILTGIGERKHTLYDLFRDIINGNLAGYLAVGENTLVLEIAEIKERLATLERGKK